MRPRLPPGGRCIASICGLSGFWAYDTGAGPIGAIIIALVAGATTLAAGRLVFDSTRNGAVRVLVALLFAAPAALAGYVVPEFMLRRRPNGPLDPEIWAVDAT